MRRVFITRGVVIKIALDMEMSRLLDSVQYSYEYCAQSEIDVSRKLRLKILKYKTVQGQCATPCTTLANPYHYEIINHVYSVQLYSTFNRFCYQISKNIHTPPSAYLLCVFICNMQQRLIQRRGLLRFLKHKPLSFGFT